MFRGAAPRTPGARGQGRAQGPAAAALSFPLLLRSSSRRAFYAYVPGPRAGSKGRAAEPSSGPLQAAQATARAPGRRGDRGAAAGSGPERARFRHSAAGLGPGPRRRGRVRRGHERGEG